MVLGALYNFELLYSKIVILRILIIFVIFKKKDKIKVHFYFFEISQCDRKIVSAIGNYPKVQGFDL